MGDSNGGTHRLPRRGVIVAGRVLATIVLALVVVSVGSAARRADDWTLGISAPATVVAGGDFTVTAKVTYTYATDTDVTVQMPLPADATVKSYSGPCTA